MDMRFAPENPAEVRLTLKMTASVREWRELAAAISTGVAAETEAKGAAVIVVRGERRAPPQVEAAERLAKTIVRMAEAAGRELGAENYVTSYSVEPVEEPAELAIKAD